MRRVSGVASRSRPTQAQHHGRHDKEHQDDAYRSQERAHERGLAVEREECVRRTVAHAARVRARQLEALGQEQARQVHHHHDGGHRERQQPIPALVEPAAGERQEQVDEERRDQPAGDPPQACRAARRPTRRALTTKLAAPATMRTSPKRSAGRRYHVCRPTASGTPTMRPRASATSPGCASAPTSSDFDRDRHGRDRRHNGGEQPDPSAAVCRRMPVHHRDRGAHVRSLTIGAAAACKPVVTSPEPSA